MAKFEPIGHSFSLDQLSIILQGLANNEDIGWYANETFTPEQMQEIRKGLNHIPPIDVSIYACPSYTWKRMKKIREKLVRKSEV